MRKVKILVTMLLCLIFAFSICLAVSAEEMENVYYVVQEEGSELEQSLIAEGKQVVSIDKLHETKNNAQSTDGTVDYFVNRFENQTLNLILAENVSYAHPNQVSDDAYCSGFRIERAMTVNVYFNGYSWWIPKDREYACISVNNDGAVLNFIGNRTLEEIKGDIDLSVLSATNQTNTVDFYGGYVGIYMSRGSLNIRNAIMTAQDEVVYQKGEYNAGVVHANFENCAAFSKSGSKAIHFHAASTSDVDFTANYLYSNHIWIDDPRADNYVKNSTIENLEIDTYGSRWMYDFIIEDSTIGFYKSVGDTQILIASDSKFDTINLNGDSSGGGKAIITDCRFDESKVVFNKPNGYLEIIKNSTCEEAGSRKIITNNSSDVDGEFAANNPKLGHTFEGEILRYSYASMMEKGIGYGACANCDGEAETALAPIFTSLGYSVSDSGDVLQGFSVNHDALNAYGKVKYGLVVALSDGLTGTDIVTTAGGANNNLGGKVFTVDFSNYTYELFEIKVTGLVTDEYKALSLYCQGYYVDNDKVYYMNDGVASDKPTATTYNEQKAIQDAKQ